MGILALFLFQVFGPFVWYYGQRALGDIDRSHGHIGGGKAIRAGRTMGAVATVLLAAPFLFILVMLMTGTLSF